MIRSILEAKKTLSEEKKQSSDYANFGHKTKNVSFWIPADTLRNWDVFADSKGLNRTELIKRAVDTLMENKKALNGNDRINDLEAKLTEKIALLDTKLEMHFIDFTAILNDVFASGLINAGLVARQSGQILYRSDNWSVEGEDVKNCIKDWHSHAQFVMLQGVKYSMLFSNQDYFTAVNRTKKSWLVGACSPKESGERYFVLGQVPAGTIDAKNAYVDLTRAASRMKEGGSSKAMDKSFGKYSKADIATGLRWYERFDEDVPKDPVLRQEIEGLLDWLHDDNGLDAWVAYYFQTKDPDWPIVAKLLKAYNEIKKEFDLKKDLKVKRNSLFKEKT